ncbi:MAG: YigZ family protein [Clostridiales bacterium]|nr:YigZ family protein [Clostridiales bacterium]MBR6487404.1 YigZ family protein [Clostridiales bacterium]
MPNESRLTSEGHSRVEIKKSVFIGHCAKVESPAEASDFIAKERKEYPDARHICYAWRTGGDSANQKSSDDGEPSGTAGQPLLALLTDNDLNNTIVCVTRYFGGILLGKGGLMRAYRESGLKALSDGNPVFMIAGRKLNIRCDYAFYEKLSRKAAQKDWACENISYDSDVSLTLLVSEEDVVEAERFLGDESCGKVVPGDGGGIMIAGNPVSLV